MKETELLLSVTLEDRTRMCNVKSIVKHQQQSGTRAKYTKAGAGEHN